MSSKYAVELNDVNKSFQLYDSPQKRLKQLLFGNITKKKYYKEFHILKDINAKIKKSKTTGIIGKNGAGKTTLLSAINGSLNIDKGEIIKNGNIQAILSLGVGFNPEFTGLENIKYRASLMGMSKDDLKRKQDKIISFADIGDFILQPIKTYSSGMVARLGYSVAAHFDPDILIIDEALSVGDEAFTRKCFAHLEKLKKNEVTIIFVSHSAQSIIQFCDEVIFLHDGQIMFQGDPNIGVKIYQKSLLDDKFDFNNIKDEIAKIENNVPTNIDKNEEAQKKDLSINEKKLVKDNEKKIDNDAFFDKNFISKSVYEYASDGAIISNIFIKDDAGNKINNLSMGMNANFTYDIEFTKDMEEYVVGFFIKNTKGLEIYGRNKTFYHAKKNNRMTFEFPISFKLLPGTYYVNAGIIAGNKKEEKFAHRIIDALAFKINPKKMDLSGIVDLSMGQVRAVKLARNKINQ